MTAALEIRNLVKKFGGLVATNDLSFDLAEGESLGLIGPNGAGKTTVFSQIMGAETDLRHHQVVWGGDKQPFHRAAHFQRGKPHLSSATPLCRAQRA